MSSNLIEELRQADQLPSAPGVALEIVKLKDQEDVDVKRLSEIVSRDPALVAKLIKTANSAMFGLPRQVSSLRQAIMVLGIRTVNLLALSFSLVPVAKGDNEVGFDYKSYWTYSIVSNLGAVFLANKTAPAMRDEAFLGGLLCELGRLVLAECAPDKYAPVLKALKNSDKPVYEVETEILGTNHMEIGQALFEDWGLPTVVCEAIGAHHDPSLLGDGNKEARRLAEILHVATTCATLYTGSNLEELVEQLGYLAASYFNLDMDACSSLLLEIEQEVGDAATLYELDTEDPRALAAIRARASELMVRETLSLNAQFAQASAETKKLEKKNEELAELATTDKLTGLRNRGFFDEMIHSELERAHQQNHTLGVLLLDLDHFKAVNDTYGHQVGDEVLRRVGSLLNEALLEGECAARYGGEELVLICAEVTREQLQERADWIREALARVEIETPQGNIKPSVSIGGAITDPVTDSASTETLVEAADRELYRAKSEGRNRAFVINLGEA